MATSRLTRFWVGVVAIDDWEFKLSLNISWGERIPGGRRNL